MSWVSSFSGMRMSGLGASEARIGRRRPIPIAECASEYNASNLSEFDVFLANFAKLAAVA